MRRIAGFCLRFLLIVPICLVLWWMLLPAYVWCLGQLVRLAVAPFVAETLTGISVVEEGILNTGTVLSLKVNQSAKEIPVAALVSNIAPYIALVLATAGMAARRRLAALGIGVAILVASHAIYLGLALVFALQIRQAPDIPTAFAQLLITLPFLLWIVLIYWKDIAAVVNPDRDSGSDT